MSEEYKSEGISSDQQPEMTLQVKVSSLYNMETTTETGTDKINVQIIPHIIGDLVYSTN